MIEGLHGPGGGQEAPARPPADFSQQRTLTVNVFHEDGTTEVAIVTGPSDLPRDYEAAANERFTKLGLPRTFDEAESVRREKGAIARQRAIEETRLYRLTGRLFDRLVRRAD